MIRYRAVMVTGFAAVATVGCSEAGDGPAGPEVPELATITVDASEDWVYVDLAETAEVVQVADASGSTAWDIGFFATSVKLNGGAAGPAEVVGHCLCANAGATDDALMQMTAESELAAFTGVTAESVPAPGEAWTSDTLVPAIDGWYAYDRSSHAVSAAPEMVWKIRAADGASYAKFHVIGIEDPSQANAGRIKIEFAYQPGADAAMGEPDTAVVDVSGGAAVYFDLATAAPSDASDWDLLFEGYTIRVNGGVSGDGAAAAVPVDEAFEEVATASDEPDHAYDSSTDAFGGVFAEHAWYRYDLAGEHQIWPTYDVYLIKRGESVFKVQLIGYYNQTGDSRHITLRYATLDS